MAFIGDENAGCAPAHSSRSDIMILNRRIKRNISLKDRLSAWARQIREQAEQLPPGPDRDPFS
jgi:hypothetical protein